MPQLSLQRYDTFRRVRANGREFVLGVAGRIEDRTRRVTEHVVTFATFAKLPTLAAFESALIQRVLLLRGDKTTYRFFARLVFSNQRDCRLYLNRQRVVFQNVVRPIETMTDAPE